MPVLRWRYTTVLGAGAHGTSNPQRRKVDLISPLAVGAVEVYRRRHLGRIRLPQGFLLVQGAQ